MKSASSSTTLTLDSRSDRDIKTLRYEDVLPAKPPIPVTVPPPRAPPTDTHPSLRSSVVGISEQDSAKRDSGLAPTTSTFARDGSLEAADDRSLNAATSGILTPLAVAPKTPIMVKSDSSSTIGKWRMANLGKKDSRVDTPKTPESGATKTFSTSDEEFSPITTPIPTDKQLHLDFMDKVTFSNRGSVLLGGKKAVNGQARTQVGRRYANCCHIY